METSLVKAQNYTVEGILKLIEDEYNSSAASENFRQLLLKFERIICLEFGVKPSISEEIKAKHFHFKIVFEFRLYLMAQNQQEIDQRLQMMLDQEKLALQGKLETCKRQMLDIIFDVHGILEDSEINLGISIAKNLSKVTQFETKSPIMYNRGKRHCQTEGSDDVEEELKNENSVKMPDASNDRAIKVAQFDHPPLNYGESMSYMIDFQDDLESINAATQSQQVEEHESQESPPSEITDLSLPQNSSQRSQAEAITQQLLLKQKIAQNKLFIQVLRDQGYSKEEIAILQNSSSKVKKDVITVHFMNRVNQNDVGVSDRDVGFAFLQIQEVELFRLLLQFVDCIMG